MIPINNQYMIKSMTPLEKQIQMKMKFVMNKFRLHFPNPSSYLGKKSSNTSTEQGLDTKWK